MENASGNCYRSVIWGFRGFSKENIPTLAKRGLGGYGIKQHIPADISRQEVVTRDEMATAEIEKEPTKAGTILKSLPKEYSKPDDDDPISRLMATTDADMIRWQEIFMPQGKECMFFVGLSVDPEYQELGVGTALMRWGTTIADKARCFAGYVLRNHHTASKRRRAMRRWVPWKSTSMRLPKGLRRIMVERGDMIIMSFGRLYEAAPNEET